MTRMRFTHAQSAEVADLSAALRAENERLRTALEDLLFWNEGIRAGRGNHHPVDHINKIKSALDAVGTGQRP